jgi:hypothetical protein
MYSDELMTDQVVTCCKCSWDSDCGIESVEDGIACPDTGIFSSRYEALLVYLDYVAVLLEM